METKENDGIPVLTDVVFQGREITDPEEIANYRLIAISTAAIGFWKEGIPIDDKFRSSALTDVAKLYRKYDTLFKAIADGKQLTEEEIRKDPAKVVRLFQAAYDKVMKIAVEGEKNIPAS